MSNSYTYGQTEEEQYRAFERYLAYLDEKMYHTKMSIYRAIYTDIADSGLDIESNVDSPNFKQMVENYFWSLGLPFVQIDKYSKWFTEQARCQDTVIGLY